MDNSEDDTHRTESNLLEWPGKHCEYHHHYPTQKITSWKWKGRQQWTTSQLSHRAACPCLLMCVFNQINLRRIPSSLWVSSGASDPMGSLDSFPKQVLMDLYQLIRYSTSTLGNSYAFSIHSLFFILAWQYESSFLL